MFRLVRSAPLFDIISWGLYMLTLGPEAGLKVGRGWYLHFCIALPIYFAAGSQPTDCTCGNTGRPRDLEGGQGWGVESPAKGVCGNQSELAGKTLESFQAGAPARFPSRVVTRLEM